MVKFIGISETKLKSTRIIALNLGSKNVYSEGYLSDDGYVREKYIVKEEFQRQKELGTFVFIEGPSTTRVKA